MSLKNGSSLIKNSSGAFLMNGGGNNRSNWSIPQSGTWQNHNLGAGGVSNIQHMYNNENFNSVDSLNQFQSNKSSQYLEPMDLDKPLDFNKMPWMKKSRKRGQSAKNFTSISFYGGKNNYKQ